MLNDPVMKVTGKSMPFDGPAHDLGRLRPINDSGNAGNPGYVDGCVIPVPAANFDAYRGDGRQTCGVPHGVRRDTHRRLLGRRRARRQGHGLQRCGAGHEGRAVVYSWVEWPSKEARDAGWKKAMEDPRMKDTKMPFDGKRMIYGGFKTILDA